MMPERPRQKPHQETRRYEFGAWRGDFNRGIADCEPAPQPGCPSGDSAFRITDLAKERRARREEQWASKFELVNPDARERSRLLRLLGLINYKVLTGNRVYVEVGGTVYRTLFGAYWRSVFTGVEHYLLKCQAVSGGIWTEGGDAVDLIDLPIGHTNDAWTAQGHSLMFLLSRD
jgi:hypothetical protein